MPTDSEIKAQMAEDAQEARKLQAAVNDAAKARDLAIEALKAANTAAIKKENDTFESRVAAIKADIAARKARLDSVDATTAFLNAR